MSPKLESKCMSLKEILYVELGERGLEEHVIADLELALLHNLERHLNSYQQLRVDQKNEIDRLDYQLEVKQNSLKSSSETIQNKENRIIHLLTDKESLTKYLAKADANVESHSKEIARLNRSLEARAKIITDQEEELKVANKRIKHLETVGV